MQRMHRTRVLIADDHIIVRKGLKQILSEGLHGFEYEEASNAHEALTILQKKSFDIVILDVSMPGKSGLDLLKDVKVLRPKLPVLILSVHPEDQYALRVMKAGASGYLTKNSAPEELVQAVKKILKGGKYVSTSFSERLVELLCDPANTEPHHRLSDREFEVLKLIASGKTVSEIAAQLSLSVKTVSTYRSRILDKLQLSTNAELTRYALQHRLV